MKKIYIDATTIKEPTSVFIKEKTINWSGTTTFSMPIENKNQEYDAIAKKHDIHFIFADKIPQINFYTVPQIEIFAQDSIGGFFGTIGQRFDEDIPICYITPNRNCFMIANDFYDFLSHLKDWKTIAKSYKEIFIYDTLKDAKKEHEILALSDL